MKVKKLAIAMGILAMGINTSVSAETFNMFEPSASGVPAAGTTNGGTLVGAATYNANINGSINEDSSVTLSLDALGESVTLDVVSVTSNGSSVSYSATSANMDVLTVTASDGVMMGSLNYNGKVYKFKPGGNGDTLIVEMAEISEVSIPLASSGSAGDEALDGAAAAAAPDGTDDGSKGIDGIDVIVAYTAGFVSEFDYVGDHNIDINNDGVMGDAADVQAAIDMYTTQMMSDTNNTFDLSLVDTKVNVVHSYQTSYSDSQNFRKDADFFQNGLAQEAVDLRSLRDTHEADIMLVMTGNSYDGCGSAGVNVQGGAEHPSNYDALAIVTEACGTGYYGFAQQLGSIFGATHEQGFCGDGFRTIMAKDCADGVGGVRFPFWSSDTNTFVGKATGSASANNAQVLRDRVQEVANFRFTPEPVGVPAMPVLGSPNGEQVSIKQLPNTFTWTTENPDRATSYILGITDTSGAPLAPPQKHTVSPADAECAGDADTTCEFSLPVTPLLPVGTIKWTVTAVNTSGNTVSEVGVTTVLDAVLTVPDQIVLDGPESIIDTSTPTYKWKADNKATWYQLVVKDAAWGDIVRQWFTMSDANCSSGTGECFVTPDVALAQEDMPVEWWVQGWNDIGYGDWSTPKTITGILLP